MTDIAKLVLEVDASQVDAASVALDKLVGSSERAETSETKRTKTTKTATEALQSLTTGETQLASVLAKRGVSEDKIAKHIERRHKVMLNSAKMTGTLALKNEAAAAREIAATEKLTASRVKAFKSGILEQRLKEIAATEKQTKALLAQAAAQQELIEKARIQQAVQKLTQSQGVGVGRITAKTSMFTAPTDVYALAGVRDPKALVKDIDAVRNAQLRLRTEYDSGAISAQAYHRTVDVLGKRMNILTEGNARHRSSFRKVTAAMASFAFETTGAIYLLTSLAAAMAAPALVGVRLAKSLEDTELGLAAILSSMGKINGKSVQLPQALSVSSDLMKQMLSDSVRFGISIDALASTLRATLAPGLAAGLNLSQIQEIATAGTIAVRTIGLDSRQTVQEIRDLVAGGIQAASSTLATSLGIKDSDILRWKQGGTIYQELTDRLKGFTQAGELSARTMTGAWEALKTKFAILMNDRQGFAGLRDALLEISDYVGVFNKETGEMEFNKALVADVNAYWGILKAVGRLIKSIGSAVGSLLPLVTPVITLLSNGVQVIARLISWILERITLAYQQLKAIASLDFSKVAELGAQYEADAAKRFDDLATSITSADSILGVFQTNLAKPVVAGFTPKVPESLATTTSYVPKGFTETEAEITGNADAAVNAAAKRWEKYIGVTQEGLKREHEMALAQFTQDEKALNLARKQQADLTGLKAYREASGRMVSISEQEKTNIDARKKYILGKETELRLAREGEERKYQEALTRILKKDNRLEAYDRLVVKLKSLGEQSSKTATEEEKVLKAFAARPEEYLAVTEVMKEALLVQARTVDMQKQALVYEEKIVQVGKRKATSLRSQIDAEVKRNDALGNSKAITREVQAAQEDLLATSLLQQSANADMAAQIDGPYREANQRLAADLRLQAKLHSDLSEELRRGAYLEAVVASDKAWQKSVRSIEQTFRKAFLTIGEAGTSMWETMTNSFQRMFRTTVLEFIYKELAKPIVLNVIASVAGVIGAPGMAQAATGQIGQDIATSAASSAAGNWLGAAGGGFSGGVQAGMTGGFQTAQGLTPLIGQGTGATATAIGSYVGAVMPYVAAWYLGTAIAGDKEVGGLSGKDATAVGMAIGTAILPGIGTLVGGALGGAFTAAFGTGPRKYEDPRLIGEFSAEAFVGDIQTKWREKGGWFRSDKTGTEVEELSEIQQSFFNTLVGGTKAAFDSLSAAAGESSRMLDDWAFEVDHLIGTQEEMTQLVADLANSMGEELFPSLVEVQKEGENLADTAIRLRDEFVLTDRVALLLGKDLEEAFGAVGIASAGTRDDLVQLAGGIAGLSSLMQAYYENFFTQEERLALDLESLTGAFEQLGFSLPATHDQFKALAEAQDLTTDSGQRTFLALLQLAPALDQVIETTDSLAESAAEAADVLGSQRRNLEIILMEETGDAAGALAARREDELALLNESLRPLQELIYAQQDLNLANEEAVYLATQQRNLEITLMEEIGDTTGALAARREDELAALDASLQPLQELVYAQQDLNLANEKASDLATQRRGLEIELMEASGDATGALAARREEELALLDESLRPLQEQIYAQQDLTAVYDEVNASLREMKLLTTDAFASAFEYTKYLRTAQNAGVFAAEGALGDPETTFSPEKADTGNAELIVEIDKLRAEIQAGQISMAQFLAESTKILRRWNGDGMPETRVVS